jgi:hypothetical protein
MVFAFAIFVLMSIDLAGREKSHLGLNDDPLVMFCLGKLNFFLGGKIVH